jgi:hypothetical protein
LADIVRAGKINDYIPSDNRFYCKFVDLRRWIYMFSVSSVGADDRYAQGQRVLDTAAKLLVLGYKALARGANLTGNYL